MRRLTGNPIPLTAVLLAMFSLLGVPAAADPKSNDTVASADTESDPHAHHRAMIEDSGADADPHAHHRAMMHSRKPYSRNTHAYDIPDVVLRNMDNEPVGINELLGSDRPVVVSFIFTTCDTICPVLTATLAAAQNDLLASPQPPLIVSVSIDPEEDTPARLKQYAAKYDASDQWVFLTGALDSIIQVQRAMDVYRGSKLNHEPVTFVKTPAENQWLRLDGFTSANALVSEYRAFIQ